MNTQQRNYLTKKIDDTRKAAVDALSYDRPKRPSLNNYLWKYAVEGTLQIQPEAHIKDVIRQKALKTEGGGADWLKDGHFGSMGRRTIEIDINDLLVVPEEYRIANEAYEEEEKRVRDQIYLLNTQADTLITRITLASDKVLQQLINEVDNMGNLSLMDTKLKQLTQ